MNLNDLPSPTDYDEIRMFAMSFNGYTHYGSFEACAEAALKEKRETLEDVRNELFFAFRAGSHLGTTDTLLNAYSKLEPFFIKFISDANSDKNN